MSIRERVSPNLLLKLLSALLALLLWLFVTLETGDETDIPLALSYANLPAGLLVKEGAPQQLFARAAGPRILLVRQKLKGAAVRLDLSTVKAGRTTFAGYENSVIPVLGVRFVRVSPVTADIYPDPAHLPGLRP